MDSKALSNDEQKGLLKAFYRTISTFFKDNDGFVNSKVNLKILFYAAFSTEVIFKDGEVFLFRKLKQGLLELIDVTHLLYESGASKRIPQLPEVLNKDEQLLKEINSVSSEGIKSQWHYFPRHLTKNEFVNPSDFFPRLFGYKNLKDWKIIFEELYSSALLHQSIVTFSDLIDNPIMIYDYSFKLVEIIHLIRIRRHHWEF